MTQGPPTRVQQPPEDTEAGAGVGHATAAGRGAPNEARRVNGSGHARGRPSLPPPLLLDTASRRCLRPTDRATRATPTAHAHAPTRGGRWPERHADGAANESAASGGAGERPVRDAKKRGRCHAPEGPRKADWAGPLRSTCLQTFLSSGCHITSTALAAPVGPPGVVCPPGGPLSGRRSPRCCQPQHWQKSCGFLRNKRHQLYHESCCSRNISFIFQLERRSSMITVVCASPTSRGRYALHV